jgi:hypothetical protein
MDLEYYLLRPFIEERRLEDEGRMKCVHKFWTEVGRQAGRETLVNKTRYKTEDPFPLTTTVYTWRSSTASKAWAWIM